MSQLPKCHYLSLILRELFRALELCRLGVGHSCVGRGSIRRHTKYDNLMFFYEFFSECHRENRWVFLGHVDHRVPGADRAGADSGLSYGVYCEYESLIDQFERTKSQKVVLSRIGYSNTRR